MQWPLSIWSCAQFTVELTGLHLVGVGQWTASGQVSGTSGSRNIWSIDGQIWKRSILPHTFVAKSFTWVVSVHWWWCCVCYMHGWRMSECKCYSILWPVQPRCTSGQLCAYCILVAFCNWLCMNVICYLILDMKLRYYVSCCTVISVAHASILLVWNVMILFIYFF